MNVRRARHLAFALMGFAGLAQMQFATASTVETLIFVRHGEKPDDVDNGQLTCRGQNRALGLPGVLIPRYGVPNYVFAAEPVENQDDNGVNYWYMRALATIEPTAVAAGVTVNVKYDKSDISDVESELAKSKYGSAIVFVAWEHTELDQLVANILHDNGGDASVVPVWPDSDYDSIFVVTLTRNGSQTTVTFTHDAEGLDNAAASCTPPNTRRPLPLPFTP
jgi:hypothetical protein